MPKTPPIQAASTLAEFTVHTYLHRQHMERKYGHDMAGARQYRRNTEAFKMLADALPDARRMSFDETLNNLVMRTKNIETKDIVPQLEFVSFPSKYIWLAGRWPFGNDARIGSLISADQENHSFKLSYIVERPDTAESLYNLKGGREFQYFSDGNVLHMHPVDIQVSPGGIKIDDDKLADMVESMQRNYAAYNRRLDATPLIDQVYSVADYITRVLVTLNSGVYPNNFLSPQTAEEKQLRELNKRRKQLHRPPILPDTPILFDVTATHSRMLDDTPINTVAELLGVVRVRQSDHIRRPDGSLWLRKRDGMPWFRKEHKRGIRAPVDRTNAPYAIKAGNPAAQIEFLPDRPPTIRPPATPAQATCG